MILELLTSVGYILVTGLIGLVTGLVIYARWHYGTLEKIKGLPVVIKPAFVGGSDVFIYKKIVPDQDITNVKKYGKLYGYYEGREPHIYVADPEIIKHILIKDFDHFRNQRSASYGDEVLNQTLDILPYEKWKVIRQFISPNLTTGKIKHMSISMTETILDWCCALKRKLEKSDNSTVSKTDFIALTCDVIARCGFGMKLNALEDPENPFVKYSNNLVGGEGDSNILLTVIQSLPFLQSLLPVLPKETVAFYRDLIKNVMVQRRACKTKLNDFIDTLNEMHAKLETDEYKRLDITESTVMAQALIFFLAGFETTASTLSFLSYNLAKNPEIQDKLIEEVDAYMIRHNGKIDHESITELTFLTACMMETLRMFPPIIHLERVCNKLWKHEPSGLEVPEGIVMLIPVHAVHYDEDFYPDPYTFKPERFLPENKDKLNQYAFLTFGLGNHNCIGMRFAKEEIHLALASILKDFKFKATPETKIKPVTGQIITFAVEPFEVEVVKRKK